MAQLQNSGITGSLIVSGTSPAGTISSSNNIITAGDLVVNGGDITSTSNIFNILPIVPSFIQSINLGNSKVDFISLKGGSLAITRIDHNLEVTGTTVLGTTASPKTTTINGNLIVNGNLSATTNNLTFSNLTVGSLTSNNNVIVSGNLIVKGNTILGDNTVDTTQVTGNLSLNNNLIIGGTSITFNQIQLDIGAAGKTVNFPGTVKFSGPVRSINTTNSTTAFQIQSATGTPVVNIDTYNRRLGINTITPLSKLHIKQSVDSIFGGLRITRSLTDSQWGIYINDIVDGSNIIHNDSLAFNWGTAPDGTGTTTKALIKRSNTSPVILNFTGQHRNKSKENLSSYLDKIGLIVVSCGIYNNLDNYTSISINEALPIVHLSDKRKQKSVFGIISNTEDAYSENRFYENGAFVSIFEKQPDDNRLIINSVGEGAIWVCNINGNLENGDYITTCEIPGLGMKQDDDLLHNYTVAKITCDCDFDLNSPIYMCEEFQFEGKTYRKAFVGCTYHCG